MAPIGGAEETRTPDFLRAKEALSQLSYSPMNLITKCREYCPERAHPQIQKLIFY